MKWKWYENEENKMQILLLLLAFSSVSWACIPSKTIRPIIAHRREFLLENSNMTDPVPVNPDALEILDNDASGFRARSDYRAEDQVEEPEVGITVPPMTTTTSTFKPDTIDDP